MDSASSSSSSAQTRRWTYDVFLSFRGKDTRNNFVDHLYKALDQAGIHTFKDDKKLIKGEPISPELVKAIEESMISVVVFSKNYANSSWCLEELVKIIECRELMGQKVLPVFYDVEPSDVRGQKGSFQEAFEQHEVNLKDNMLKVRRWREALVTAANLSGWDVPRTASGHEAECIKQIVPTILSYTQSYPAENLIGMESRIRDVRLLLGKRSDDVCMIGIWGMGGIGKTTIARAVYHQISSEFKGSSFIESVRENGSDSKGLKSLQEKLLSEILLEKDFKVKDCDDGICQIRRRLGRKKVLIVLDDVENITQLEFLVGAREWFGHGSRIMITTRDEHLLCHVQEKYAPELLKETEAMKLFSRYAFNANNPLKAYEKLSDVVVNHTGHLPLALKVLGSYFCGRNLDFWQSALRVLTKIPHKDINGILELSFNGLNTIEKTIFLYIACFYKGQGKRDVTRILDGCGLEAVSGITVLIEKSLLTISNGDLHMHDLIQEMGRYIVRKSYPNTMVWIPQEIEEVMMTISASPSLTCYSNLDCFGPPSSFDSDIDCKLQRLERVEAIVETENDGYSFSSKVFKRMMKLILLQVRGRFISSEPTYFPQQLRWLNWFEYPFKSMRLARGMTNLVGLQMPNSNINQLGMEKKVILPNLKSIDLSYSCSITSFPDVSGLPNLENLNLSFCESLVEVHQSVLHHEKIAHLNLSKCGSLKTLPPSIDMQSLQTLRLNGCNLKMFPEISREMGRLLFLFLDSCSMSLPGMRCFTGLIAAVMGKAFFRFNYKYKWGITGFNPLTCLRILDLSFLKYDDFPCDVRNVWPSLEELDLSENLFSCIPSNISQLRYLKYLDLSYIINLLELHELPPLIQVLKANCCLSLEKIGDFSDKNKWLFKISLCGCSNLLNDEKSDINVANMLMKSLVQKCAVVNHRLSISVPGSKIPNWFSSQRSGNKITLNLPQNQITNMIGLAVCCVFCPTLDKPLRIKFKASGVEKLLDTPTTLAAKSADTVWVGYMPIDFLQKLWYGFESEHLIIDIFGNHDVGKCGVCVVYKDDIKGMTRTGSWIRDYDESEWIDHDSASGEDLQHGRWSKPTFSYYTTGGRKEVDVCV